MAPLPTKQDILDFIRSSPGKVGKREIARAFQIKGSDRSVLKSLLREMADDGLIERGHKRRLQQAGTLPSVTVLEIVDRDTDGELLCRPVHDAPESVRIYLAPDRKRRGPARAVGIGDRVLARLKRIDDTTYEAALIKTLGQSAHHVLGVYREGPHKNEGRIQPVDRKSRYELIVHERDRLNAEPNDLVTVEILNTRPYGLKQARVREVHGKISDHRSISLIAIHAHGLPTGFDERELDEAERAGPATLAERSDLRDLPFVTIDPVTARDFDDAVHAQRDTDPSNADGWIVTVAIADVAHYVRPASALDEGARRRGNSCYFPDRVIPMLPEKLSNDLCSLRPKTERACLVVRMRFAGDGRKLDHVFLRGIMRSAARLTYEQAQAAIDGRPDDATEPLVTSILTPLWQAYRALLRARQARGPLALEVPEHVVELSASGFIENIGFREHLEAHQLIEEFMIQANVAAAETLEQARIPLIYRVHEPPPADKLESLRDFLESLDMSLARGQTLRPRDFNALLAKVKGTDFEELISEVVLRSQCQAIYSPRNLGHFGLNLRRYAHFTSPIRRYADLVVHRALIRAGGFGTDGLTDSEIERLSDTADHISMCERRGLAAERESMDRYLAAHLEDRVGAIFSGRISGVTRFGLFIRLLETGADGIVPMRSLADDRYEHEPRYHALIGVNHGGVYRLGQKVKVRLLEAAPLAGALRFEILTAPDFELQLRPRKGPRPARRSSRKRSR